MANKRALMVWGGWDGHQPKECVETVKPQLEALGFDVVVSATNEIYADASVMDALSLIVQSVTCGKLGGPARDGLMKAVRDNGVGLGGWHGGLCDAYREDCDWQFLTGGQFVAHPGNIIPYTVNITSSDPIVAGITDFEMVSEQYYMHVDPANEVLATTTFSGEHAAWTKGVVMPTIWKRTFGKGRVFYSALGHVATDLVVPNAMTILKRGLLWAAK